MLRNLEGRFNRVCLVYHGLSNSQTFSSNVNSVGLRKVQYNEFSAGAIHDMTKRSFEDVKQVSIECMSHIYGCTKMITHSHVILEKF